MIYANFFYFHSQSEEQLQILHSLPSIYYLRLEQINILMAWPGHHTWRPEYD